MSQKDQREVGFSSEDGVAGRYTEANLPYNIEDLRRIWQQATGDLDGG